MEDTINLIYVRFDKSLDYKAIVNSYPIKMFCQSAFGGDVKFVTPVRYTFDRDALGVYVQNQYDKSRQYVVESRRVPHYISESYGDEVVMKEFEADLCTLDDHLVVMMTGDTVLGVVATDFDFEKLIKEI